MLRERRWACASLCGDTGQRYAWQYMAGRWSHGFPLANKFRGHVCPSRAKPSGDIQRSPSPRGPTRWVALGRTGARGKGRRPTTTLEWNLETIRYSGVRWQQARGHIVVIGPRHLSLG